MAVVRSAFFDTSVLLPALVLTAGRDAPPRQLMRAVIDGRLGQPQTAWHCCLEFFAVSTRLPEEVRLSPAEALFLIQREILARFRVHQLPTESQGSFFEVAAGEGIAGGRIYDAHIAEVARTAGARVVVTENRRHFTGLLRHGVRVVTAQEALTDYGLEP